MAIGATVHRIAISLSDVDRGVYAELDLRVARHPSESASFLLARVIAYCLFYEEGIAFSKGGVSSTDEPAVSARDLHGDLTLWIEVGTPSADRLHRASKASPKVAVVTHHDPALLDREAASRAIHRAEDIEVVVLPPAFLAALEPMLQRSVAWNVLHSDGTLYVTAGDETISTPIVRRPLAAPLTEGVFP